MTQLQHWQHTHTHKRKHLGTERHKGNSQQQLGHLLPLLPCQAGAAPLHAHGMR